MKLIAAEMARTFIPLTTPFRTALRQINGIEEVRVKLKTDNGLQGVGSAAPTAAITGETAASIQAAIEDYLLPALFNVALEDQVTVFSRLERALMHNRSAKAAVDIALHDLYAKAASQPLITWMGGVAATALKTDATVSLGTVESMVAQANTLCIAGFHTLKVKLGGHDGVDLERMAAIRLAVGAGIGLRVDANQAWSVRETKSYLRPLADLAVELVEQPVLAQNIEGLAEITRESPMPIVADESVYGLDDLLRLIQLRAADVVNLKLMKTGGLHQARTMIAVARSQGLKIMIGSMMEGIISISAAAALASVYAVDYLDLDAGYFLERQDVQGGLSYNGPKLTLPTGLGLGITDDRLARVHWRKEIAVDG